MRHLISLPLLGLVMLLPSTLPPAGEIRHVVREGESASSIARDHYGRVEEGEFLLRYNGKASTVLRVGETLRIPYCEVHVVRPGDTWSTIAQKYFGRPSIYPALAALNRLPAGRPLRPGQELIMPVATGHRLQRGETLNLLAHRHLGDPELHTAIQIFNDIADPHRLATGREIRIPRLAPRLRRGSAPEAPARASAPPSQAEITQTATRTAAPPGEAVEAPAAPAAPPAEAVEVPAAPPPTPAPPRFSAPLEAAAQAYARGDFERARGILQAQGPHIRARGTRQDVTDYWRLLAFLEVAFDRTEAACKAFRSLHEADGPQQLDADRVSPKIRAVAHSCDAGQPAPARGRQARRGS